MFRVTGDLSAVSAMEDPKSMADESMYEEFAGVDALGKQQCSITVV